VTAVSAPMAGMLRQLSYTCASKPLDPSAPRPKKLLPARARSPKSRHSRRPRRSRALLLLSSSGLSRGSMVQRGRTDDGVVSKATRAAPWSIHSERFSQADGWVLGPSPRMTVDGCGARITNAPRQPPRAASFKIVSNARLGRVSAFAPRFSRDDLCLRPGRQSSVMAAVRA
jgi:hypothetical protein